MNTFEHIWIDGHYFARIIAGYRGCYMMIKLDTADTRKAQRPSYRYDCIMPDGAQFKGNQYRPAPSDLDSKDKILDGLLLWLTLKPGDTDASHFADYTHAQLAWATSSECEYLQCELQESE